MGKLVSPDSLTPHPTLPQTIPALSEDEFSDLLESIRTFGQQQDIVVDSAGIIIDGHNRWKAAIKLGMEQVSVFPNHSLTPGMAERLGIELNANRRQWTREQRRAAVVRLLKLEPARSDSAIARSASVSDKTVAVVRAELVDGSEIPNQQTRVGRDGVKQPATKPRSKPRTPETAAGTTKSAHKNGDGRRHPNKMAVQAGLTPEAAFRSIADFRAEGGSIVDAAKRVGMQTAAFAYVEKIVVLADREDLAEEDRDAARIALDDLNEYRQPRVAFQRVESLFNRLYGNSKHSQLSEREAHKMEAFERQWGAVIEACNRAPEIQVPHISPSRASEMLTETEEARRQIGVLGSRIKEFVR